MRKDFPLSEVLEFLITSTYHTLIIKKILGKGICAQEPSLGTLGSAGE